MAQNDERDELDEMNESDTEMSDGKKRQEDMAMEEESQQETASQSDDV